MWTTLAFHRQFHTDLVKAMSDYPFPKPAGKWHELKVVNNPFPRAMAGAGADSRRPARPSLFCRDHLQPMERGGEDVVAGRGAATQTGNPKALEAALEAIAESEASHARKAVAMANAQDGIMTQEDHARFSEPFDRLILDAGSGAPLNILHLRGGKVYLDRFVKGWPAAAINYSNFGTG